MDLPSIEDLTTFVTAHSETRERVNSENQRQYLEKMQNAYSAFLTQCMPEDLNNKIIEAAKRGQKRVNLLVFKLKDRVYEDITYCSLLQGTHNTELERAMHSHWVTQFKGSETFKPVLQELATRLGITKDSKYTLRCYKFGNISWAVELEWVDDPDHSKKLAAYKERFGNPW